MCWVLPLTEGRNFPRALPALPFTSQLLRCRTKRWSLRSLRRALRLLIFCVRSSREERLGCLEEQGSARPCSCKNLFTTPQRRMEGIPCLQESEKEQERATTCTGK